MVAGRKLGTEPIAGCDACSSDPADLENADRGRPSILEREWGTWYHDDEDEFHSGKWLDRTL